MEPCPRPTKTPFRFKAETAWRDLDALPIILVNQAVGQVLQGDIVVTFGRVMPPPLIGSDEQKQRQVEALGVLPIIPVVRLTMTINRLREFKKTLEETIVIYEREQELLEKFGEPTTEEDAPSMSVMVEESASTPTRLFLVASSPTRLVVQIPMDSRPQIVTLDIGTAGTSSPDPFGGRHPLLVSDLGWSREEAAEVRAQFAAFEEDWDAPGMDAYDAL